MADEAMLADLLADIVFINGVVYTADAQERICQAVAVKADKIVYVGTSEQAAAYIGKSTKQIDLQGKMVIPGMIDSHIHPPGIALSELYEVQLYGITTLAGYQQAVKEFIAQHPGIKAVFGQGWLWSAFSGEEANKGPRKEYLDAVAPDIPVVLRAMDGHSWWLNSKALADSGITKDTMAPEGGIIEKGADREVWGILKESAMSLSIQPDYTLEQYTEAMQAFQDKMHSLGITGILSIMGRSTDLVLKAWDKLRQQGKLALKVRGAIMIHPQEPVLDQLAAIDKLRQEYDAGDFRIITAKFFADGVVEGGTSYLLEPYTAETGKGPECYGEFLWDRDELTAAFGEANRRGLQIHVHSTGDASTRKVLDALEAARREIAGDFRNTITHLQLVHPNDILRFRKLDVIASVQPYWHFKSPSWWHYVDARILGQKRAEQEYPLRSFADAGVTLASSSDYSITPVPYPLYAIETGVTRNMYSGPALGVEDITDMDDERYLLNKAERLTVPQMLNSFTSNGAYALFMEQQTGSIEPGKQADLVVLDRDLLTINPVDIDSVKVLMTFFNGKLVYEKQH